MKKPAQIGPWSHSWGSSRHWFTRGEAARVYHHKDGDLPPWAWCVWFEDATSFASQDGRANTKEEAQSAADKALRQKGYVLA